MLGIWIAFTPISLFALISLYHILEFIYDSHHLRIYPGPWLAKFSRLWLASAARSGQRYLAIHQAHLKYGQPLVRVYLFFFFVGQCLGFGSPNGLLVLVSLLLLLIIKVGW